MMNINAPLNRRDAISATADEPKSFARRSE